MSDYLLSDGERNDEVGIAIQNDVATLMTPYHVLNKEQTPENFSFHYQEEDKLDIFSKILQVVPAFAYDHPEILEKFPHGMVTENAIFIPASIYEQIGGLKDEKGFFYKHENLSSIAFSVYLTEMIGHKYGIKFSEDDYTAILKTTFAKCHEHTLDYALRDYQAVAGNTKPEFISNSDLAKLCDNLNIASAKTIKNWGNDNSFIDKILANSDTVNIENHPFNKVKSLIKPVNTEAVNPHATFEDFKNIHQDGSNHVVIPKALETLAAMNEQLLKDNPDINTYISKLGDNIIPSLTYLNDKQFQLAVNNFKNQLEINQQQELSTEIRTQIAKAIVNYTGKTQGITTYQREILIGAMTNLDKIGYRGEQPFVNRRDDVRKENQENNQKGLTPHKMK